jgi:preprotein translocase subunit SecG
MTWVITLLVVVQILAALVMISLILVQHGKGADMGASFGSGASGSLFGATGSANFLSRSTAVCATIFFATTLLITYFSSHAATQSPHSSSILDRPLAASAPSSNASGAAIAPQLPVASGAAAIPNK